MSPQNIKRKIVFNLEHPTRPWQIGLKTMLGAIFYPGYDTTAGNFGFRELIGLRETPAEV
jgi:hypothetical protein